MLYLVKIIEVLFVFSLVLNAVIILPQLIKTLRIKNAADLSLISFLGIWLIQVFTAIHAYFDNDSSLLVGMLFSMLPTMALIISIIYFNFFKRKTI